MTAETAAPAVPRWEADAKESIKRAKALAAPAAALRDRDANEGDTRLLVTDFLVDVLGYDKYADLSTEYQTRGEFADYGLRVDGQLVMMVEVKRAKQKLNERHLRQVESYGLKEGVSWLVLTNGVEWELYHLSSTGDTPAKVVKAFTVSLESLDRAALENLTALHKQMVKRGKLDAAWTRISALAPENLRQTILSERVVNAVRLEVRATTGLNASAEDIRLALAEV